MSLLLSSNSKISFQEATPPPKNADDVLDILNEEEPESSKEEPKPEKKEEIKEEEDEGEEEEVLEEEEEEDKIDLKEEEEEIEAPPRKKQLLKDYPDLFKKHPYLEKIIYRDKVYNELFGSLDDAKEVAEKAEILDRFDADLSKGNIENVLKSVKNTDPKAFDKVVDDYLVALSKVDRDAYFDVTGNIVKQLIKEMADDGDEALKEAALIVNKFLFRSNELAPVKVRANSKTEEDDEGKREREAFIQERFESARDDIQTKVDNVLRSTVDSYIDKQGVMTPYIKKNAIKDALSEIHEVINKDPSFRKSLDRLWQSAYNEKFSKTSLDRIKSTYLGRAKQNLASVIKKARSEALKDLPPRSKKETEEEVEETPISRKPITPGRPRQTQGGKNERKKGESVADFLMRD